ncbi:MAG: phosphatidylinositol kinase [Acidimicrobiales bacterium]|nr:MAG: phosphatidylinositol kinase [Acidimicrobiales bacterium]
MNPTESHHVGASNTVSVTRQLAAGELELRAQLVTGNNAVFLADVVAGENSMGGAVGAGEPLRCVYKPVRGEQPLWDFPGKTLAPREVAAYLIDRATGWEMVPPTVLRDGPLGRGVCQLWVDDDVAATQFDVVSPQQLPKGWKVVARGVAAEPASEETDDADAASWETGDDGTAVVFARREVLLAHADDPRLAQLAIFDAVINNSDRKAGHVITDATGRLWAIDHGISFHSEPKLRTVLWGWAGEPLSEGIVGVLTRLDTELRGALGTELELYLDADERAALSDRVQQLLLDHRFPQPTPGWPVLPYPLF